jgi:hypothetical protein
VKKWQADTGGVVRRENGEILAQVYGNGMAVNTSLIAAAPDGHEILSLLDEWEKRWPSPDSLFDDTRTWRQAVKDYLAKAEGKLCD